MTDYDRGVAITNTSNGNGTKESRDHLALHLHGTQRTAARHSVVFVHVSLAAGQPPKHTLSPLLLPQPLIPPPKKSVRQSLLRQQQKTSRFSSAGAGSFISVRKCPTKAVNPPGSARELLSSHSCRCAWTSRCVRLCLCDSSRLNAQPPSECLESCALQNKSR